MSRHRCTKDLYKAFFQVSSVRYSGLSLSEVSPKEVSHDSVTNWLKQTHFRPREIWQVAQKHIDLSSPCLLVVDDTILSKIHSKKIESVHPQYSGNMHGV